MFNIEYFQPEQRRNHFMELLRKEFGNAQREIIFYDFTQGSPELLKNLAFSEDRVFHPNVLPEKKLGESNAYWCTTCQQYIWKVKGNSWQSHIFDETHIDNLAKSHLYNFGKPSGLSFKGNRNF